MARGQPKEGVQPRVGGRSAGLCVFIGTRAQLIKMAPVMAEMSRRAIRYVFVWTGQHHATIDDLLANFRLRTPDVTLTGQRRDVTGVAQMAVWLMRAMWGVLARRRLLFPRGGGVAVVHGDTVSTLLGAIAGKLAGQRVAHIEGGLRSFNIFHPFPEELTRLLVSRMADYHFCPDQAAVSNLRAVRGVKFSCGGNTLYDALRVALQDCPGPLGQANRTYAVASIHRFENICSKKNLLRVVEVMECTAKRLELVLVLHKPTEEKLKAFGLYERLASNPRIHLHPRCDYPSFIRLCHGSQFLLTDGGSNQEESFYMGHPCLLLRMATERREGLGRNVVLSRFDSSVIRDFLAGYQQYGYPALELAHSPSCFIVDRLAELTAQRGAG